ncbi:MAG: hypothetical protein LBL01_05545, partial [Bifidobacteriaceae bacterium]|nr:hypothetical protein [Bifidobacteriaceae bacterium]
RQSARIVQLFSPVATRHVRDARTQDQITALARRVALAGAPPPRDGKPREPSEPDAPGGAV